MQAASLEHIASVYGGLCSVAVAVWVGIFSSPPAVGVFFKPSFRFLPTECM